MKTAVLEDGRCYCDTLPPDAIRVAISDESYIALSLALAPGKVTSATCPDGKTTSALPSGLTSNRPPLDMALIKALRSSLVGGGVVLSMA